MKKLSQILTYTALGIGFIALCLMGGIMWLSDSVSSDLSVQSFTIDPMFYITYALLAITIITILFFVILGWVKNPKSFTSSLKYIGVFVAIAIISYFLVDNSEMTLPNGKSVSQTDNFIADFGLWMSYILVGLALIAGLFGGFLKNVK